MKHIRIRYNHTRMVQKIIPYAYGTYRTRTVCTIRVWYEPYAYGMKYAYGTQQSHAIARDFTDCEMISVTIIYKVYNYNDGWI